jgi:hypothetical protein
MTEEIHIPDIVPVFPLPGVVLFPHAVLPLHIFEERYRAMTRDALAGGRMIAMAMLAPGWEKDYEGVPPIHAVGCVGRIVGEQELPDGKFNFMLQGLARVRFVHEFPPAPYRSARIEILREKAADPAREGELRQDLISAFGDILAGSSVEAKAMEHLPNMPLGAVADLIGAAVSAEPGARQTLLEELDAARRAMRVRDLLTYGRFARLDQRMPREPSDN